MVAAYVAAFSVAGALIGLLAPMRRSRISAYALGFIGAGIFAAIIGVVVMVSKQERDWAAYTSRCRS